MTVRVLDLLPGDKVTNAAMTAVHITHVGHPYYPDLQLVIWRLHDGTVSLDALAIVQDVGDLVPQQWHDRRATLLAALTGWP